MSKGGAALYRRLKMEQKAKENEEPEEDPTRFLPNHKENRFKNTYFSPKGASLINQTMKQVQ